MPEEQVDTSIFQNRIKQLKEAEDEQERFTLAKILFHLIQQNSKSIIDRMDDGMAVENFDEVSATLHNEFNRNIRVLKRILDSTNTAKNEQVAILNEIKKQHDKRLQDSFQQIVIKNPRDRVLVENLGDIFIPDSVRVNNLDDINSQFDLLRDVIQKTFNIKIPAPQVNVQPPEVNVSPQLNNEIDLSVLEARLKNISQSLIKIKNNKVTNPLAVRLSDGREWIEQIVAEIGQVQTALAGFSDRMRLVNKQGKEIGDDLQLPTALGTGNKNVTTAGTAVVLGSGSCKWVIMTGKQANTGKIYVGGADVDSSNGLFIYPSQSTEKLPVSSLDAVYIDADTNGEGVQFTYGT